MRVNILTFGDSYDIIFGLVSNYDFKLGQKKDNNLLFSNNKHFSTKMKAVKSKLLYKKSVKYLYK